MINIFVCIPSWNMERAYKVVDNLSYTKGNDSSLSFYVSTHDKAAKPLGVVEAMAQIINPLNADIIVFCHDDIEVLDDWTTPIIKLFSEPDIGLVGFHGAKGLGTADICRTPYHLAQLARFNPMSNMKDAEVHGKRIQIPTQVATIDGFFMAFKREAYEAIGGWQACLDDGIVFHMYDAWAAMKVQQHGYKVYMAPVDCIHKGGQTEVGMAEQYEQWCRDNGFKSGMDLHEKMHEQFYEIFRGQLPVRIR